MTGALEQIFASWETWEIIFAIVVWVLVLVAWAYSKINKEPNREGT